MLLVHAVERLLLVVLVAGSCELVVRAVSVDLLVTVNVDLNALWRVHQRWLTLLVGWMLWWRRHLLTWHGRLAELLVRVLLGRRGWHILLQRGILAWELWIWWLTWHLHRVCWVWISIIVAVGRHTSGHHSWCTWHVWHSSALGAISLIEHLRHSRLALAISLTTSLIHVEE